MKKIVLILLLLPPIWVEAQIFDPKKYAEMPDDAYMPVAKTQRRTSPPYHFQSSGFSIVQVNVDENGQNIVLDAANEPSIVIDPNNPARMAIGWRQFDTIASNFRQAGYAYTTDAGATWRFPGNIEPGIFRSDPVLESDTDGNFFYNSLSNTTGNYECYVFKSENGGSDWDSGTFAYGGDKQWMAIDRTGSTSNGNIYAFWKSDISACSGGFTRSLDQGQSYENCTFVPTEPTRGTLVVGANGELYACGGTGSGFSVMKSTDIATVGQQFSWDFAQAVDLGGEIALYSGPNPSGMLGQVWIDVDQSGGANHGNVYLLATVKRSNNDPADIMFSRSTDGAQTWSTALRINEDISTTNYQWFGSLSVAPNGRIDITWVDTRDFPGQFLSRLYYSYSTDGGNTWSPNEALSEAFDPHLGWPNQQKLGDYYQQRSDDAGVHLAWAATFNGEEDIYYSYIVPEIVSAIENQAIAQTNTVRVLPNPFFASPTFQVTLQANVALLTIDVFDARGQMVQRLSKTNVIPGGCSFEWVAPSVPGIYFYRCVADGQTIGTGKCEKQ